VLFSSKPVVSLPRLASLPVVLGLRAGRGGLDLDRALRLCDGRHDLVRRARVEKGRQCVGVLAHEDVEHVPHVAQQARAAVRRRGRRSIAIAAVAVTVMPVTVPVVTVRMVTVRMVTVSRSPRAAVMIVGDERARGGVREVGHVAGHRAHARDRAVRRETVDDGVGHVGRRRRRVEDAARRHRRRNAAAAGAVARAAASAV